MDESATTALVERVIEHYRKSLLPTNMADQTGQRLFNLLERAAINRSCEGAATESRHVLWLDELIKALEESAGEKDLADSPESQQKLQTVIINLSAFRDIERIMDMKPGKMNFSDPHRLILSYVEFALLASGRSKIEQNEIVRWLNKEYRQQTGSGCRLGLPTNIDFEILNRVLKVTILKPLENMQNNASAFESWILCLKRWIGQGFDYVLIDWKLPETLQEGYVSDQSMRLHYNRFLFRVHGLMTMYPEWCTATEQGILEVHSFMEWFQEGCLINQPLQESKNHHENDAILDCERKIESWFSMDPQGKALLAMKANVDFAAIFHQLPIGIFRDKIDSRSAVMNRGASAIDLWALNEARDELHIFELKKKNNKSVGIISELLLYTMLIYEASIRQDGCLKFEFYKAENDFRGFKLIKDNKYKELKAHLLVEDLHPMLDEQLIELLNQGFKRIGAITVDVIYYNYEKRTIQ